MTENDRKPLITELARAADVAIRLERLDEVARIAAANVELLRAATADEDFARQPLDFIATLRSARDD
jgi:hypothetical protein